MIKAMGKENSLIGEKGGKTGGSRGKNPNPKPKSKEATEKEKIQL
ncbi:MAG: hypothetical protein AB4063_18330 [Crocosphaera sp.]